MLNETLKWVRFFCRLRKYPYVITKQEGSQKRIIVVSDLLCKEFHGDMALQKIYWEAKHDRILNTYSVFQKEILNKRVIDLDAHYQIVFYADHDLLEDALFLLDNHQRIGIWDYCAQDDYLDMRDIEFEDITNMSLPSKRYLLAKNHKPIKDAMKSADVQDLTVVGAYWAYLKHQPRHIHISHIRGGCSGNRFGIYEIEEKTELNDLDHLDTLYIDPLTKLPNVQYYQTLYYNSYKEDEIEANIGLIVLNVISMDSAVNAFGKKQVLTFYRALQRFASSIEYDAKLFAINNHTFGIYMGYTRLSRMQAFAAELLDHFKTPWYFDQFIFFSNVHIGMSLGQPEKANPMELLQEANLAMSESVDNQASSIQMYEHAIKEKESQRIKLQGEIKTAVDNGEFILHYQPQVDPHTQHIKGVEALIRWQHPEKGMVMPYVFLPTAEEVGTIYMIDQLVVHKCAEMQVRLTEQGFGHVDVSLNISSLSLNSEVLDKEIIDIVTMYGANPHRIIIEITESVKIFDSLKALNILNSLRNHGFRIALDDFGTGYSSLNYLAILPIDILKIDKVYVDEFTHIPSIRFLTEKIVEISDFYHFEIIAEGIEQEEQVVELKKLRANDFLIQGYYYYKPMDEEQLILCLKGLS